METDWQQIEVFIAEEIARFYQMRLEKVQQFRLRDLLKHRNPYLFRVKDILAAQDLTENLMDAVLSSYEETILGDRLEAIAIRACERVYRGQKSPANGLDLDFTRDGVRYLVSVKSGKNWGNSSQHKQQNRNFQEAVRIVRQSKYVGQVVCILGICYGGAKRKDDGIKVQLCGQDFWELVSGEPEFYKDLLESIGKAAKEHNQAYREEKSKLINRVTKEILTDFALSDGSLDWGKILTLNSGSLG